MATSLSISAESPASRFILYSRLNKHSFLRFVRCFIHILASTVLVAVPTHSTHEFGVHVEEDWMTNDDVEENCMDVDIMNIDQPEESERSGGRGNQEITMNIVVRSGRRKRVAEDDIFDWSAKRWNTAAR